MKITRRDDTQMKNMYLVCVQGDYLKSINNFEVSTTDKLNQASFFDYGEALENVSMLNLLGYDAVVTEYIYKEIVNPKNFNKDGLFVIKMNDGSFWSWDYYGNESTTPTLSCDSIFNSYKECQRRMKAQKIEGQAVQLQY